MKQAILLISETGLPVAQTISKELNNAPIYTTKEIDGCKTISSYATFIKENFNELDALIHIGALGIVGSRHAGRKVQLAYICQPERDEPVYLSFC